LRKEHANNKKSSALMSLQKESEIQGGVITAIKNEWDELTSCESFRKDARGKGKAQHAPLFANNHIALVAACGAVDIEDEDPVAVGRHNVGERRLMCGPPNHLEENLVRRTPPRPTKGEEWEQTSPLIAVLISDDVRAADPHATKRESTTSPAKARLAIAIYLAGGVLDVPLGGFPRVRPGTQPSHGVNTLKREKVLSWTKLLWTGSSPQPLLKLTPRVSFELVNVKLESRWQGLDRPGEIRDLLVGKKKNFVANTKNIIIPIRCAQPFGRNRSLQTRPSAAFLCV
jgi:hypothetical protein